MRAKDYLKNIRRIDRIISDKRDEIERLRELVTSISVPMGEKVQTSSTGDKQERMIIDYLTQSYELEDEIIRLSKERLEALRTIELLNDPAEYAVIYDCYVNGIEDFNRIADNINRSYSFVVKRHSRGIKKIQEIINERYERTEK